jgi:pimeloyl-ACP methyl ester carboxylesterase
VHLVGHSSGGALVFYLALQHPEIVKTLTIVAHGPETPPAGEGPTKFEPLLAKCPPPPGYDYAYCRLQALGYSPNTFPPEFMKADAWMSRQAVAVSARKRMDALGASRPQAAGGSDSNAMRDEAWDKARNGALQMPILIYAGKQDPLGWAAADAGSLMRGELGFFDIVGAKNPRVQMIVVNQAGHFPYREHPEQFNADLAGFIDFWNARQ